MTNSSQLIILVILGTSLLFFNFTLAQITDQMPTEGPYFFLEKTFVDLGEKKTSGKYNISAHPSVNWQVSSPAIDQGILTLSKITGQGSAEIIFSVDKSKLETGWHDLPINYSWKAFFQGQEIIGQDFLTIRIYVTLTHPASEIVPIKEKEKILPSRLSTQQAPPQKDLILTLFPSKIIPEPLRKIFEEVKKFPLGQAIVIIFLLLTLIVGLIYGSRFLEWFHELLKKLNKLNRCSTCRGSGRIEEKVKKKCSSCVSIEFEKEKIRQRIAQIMKYIEDLKFIKAPDSPLGEGSSLEEKITDNASTIYQLEYESLIDKYQDYHKKKRKCTICKGEGWYEEKVSKTCPTCKGRKFVVE